MTYHPVPPQVDLPTLEHEILDFWRTHGTFEKSVERNAGNGRTWTFYEGPPTANGQPGTHHVESRTFKDLFPRFKTMQGYQVTRKGGWDCHGLPVELAVEKELGFSGKPDIEAYGIAEFNARCRESVLRHVDLWEEMTDRMGCWVDMRDPYRTMDPEYVDSVWWALKRIFDQGLLEEDHRVAPYCPRCGTALSDHELGQPGAYETITDPSVYVRFPLTSGPLAGRASLLVWTTTPWTLVSNALVATHPDFTYVAVTDGSADRPGEVVVVARDLVEQALGEGWTETGETFTGSEMAGWTYERPLDLLEWPARLDDRDLPDAHFVVTEDYVTAEDGTGLVHQSPAFGEDDFASCRRNGVAMVNPIDGQGRFFEDVPLVGGQFFRHANTDLVAELEKRGALFRHVAYEHSYPHCWRCHTTLIYYAMPSWYIRTTQRKEALLAENEATSWYPATIKHGRYGDWLTNNIDWALSRSRYWGTPLPIWRCEAGHVTCVGSRRELGELSGSDQTDLDPHRPYVDAITFPCPSTGSGTGPEGSGPSTGSGTGPEGPGPSTGSGDVCGETATRVPEVIDGWFDSGSMPFAQWGYPHVEGSQERFDRAYPADFICEAIDQTRGWFYTLMAVNTLVFDASSYRNVVCLGLLLAEDGRKMSKHLGNILLPIPLMDEHGADALRWFMACSGTPWSARRVGPQVLQEIVRKVLLTYWNTVAFQALYARANDWTPGSDVPEVGERPVLDRWLHAETTRLVREATAAYESFDTTRLGSLLAGFVDDLSNWYVRRSRRRFWDGDPAALQTLHDTLETLTKLLAPLVPFVTERVWQDLVVPATPGAAESVHLADWPVLAESAVDERLSHAVGVARRLVELGRAARAEAKVRTRQPLARALVGSAAYDALDEDLRREVAEELNVGGLAKLSDAGGDLVSYSAKGNFRALGKRFAKRTPVVAAAVAAADAARLAASLAETGTATVVVDGEEVQVGAEDVILSERPSEGWSVVNEQGETVALDLHLTPELVRAGTARELVRAVQEARKASGFEVSDRIALTWAAGGETAQAVEEHEELVSTEVLATTMTRVDSLDGDAFGDDELGVRFLVRRS